MGAVTAFTTVPAAASAAPTPFADEPPPLPQRERVLAAWRTCVETLDRALMDHGRHEDALRLAEADAATSAARIALTVEGKDAPTRRPRLAVALADDRAYQNQQRNLSVLRRRVVCVDGHPPGVHAVVIRAIRDAAGLAKG